jgi:hypothetical protein
MVLKGIDALDRDPETKVIVVVSKPPARKVMDRIMNRLRECRKPAVACFIAAERIDDPKVFTVRTLQGAAHAAVEFAKGRKADQISLAVSDDTVRKLAADLRQKLDGRQKYVRGLYTGGSLCDESMMILRDALGTIHSNIPLKGQPKLDDPEKSVENTIIDLGDDYFTQGKPHPMIEPFPRAERLKREAADPEVAVILMDFVLGYGSHPDPAGAMLDAIRYAKGAAKKRGQQIIFVGSVTGTEKDFQGLAGQEGKLRDEGVILMSSNAQSAILTSHVLRK